MQIVVLGNSGYLGNNKGKEPTIVLSRNEARTFNTKTQAERAIKRIKKNTPSFDLTEHSIETSTKSVA